MKNQVKSGEFLNKSDENNFEEFSFNDSAALIEASENVENSRFFVFVF